MKKSLVLLVLIIVLVNSNNKHRRSKKKQFVVYHDQGTPVKTDYYRPDGSVLSVGHNNIDVLGHTSYVSPVYQPVVQTVHPVVHNVHPYVQTVHPVVHTVNTVQPVINAVYENALQPVVEEHHVVEPVRLVAPEYARPKVHTTSVGQQLLRNQYTTYENEHRLVNSVDPYTGMISTHEQVIQHPVIHTHDTVQHVEHHQIRHLDGSPIGQKVIAFHGLDRKKL